ncbi:eCIS core domain-containing protein [Rhodanobacter sp. UC4437_H4]
MRNRTQAALCVAGILLSVSTSAMADFWSQARDRLGDVGTAVWHGTTAPIQSIINTVPVITGEKNPSYIFEPYKRAASDYGDAVEGGYSLAQSPERFLYERAGRYARKWGGDTGAFVFDIATFNHDLMMDLGASGVGGSANLLRGENPLQLVAAPLAAAIRSARDQHYPQSRPLPPDVLSGLQGLFQASTLARARYTIGRIDITLPNFIGQGQRFMGGDYAVTVDDVIVFNAEPPTFSENPIWWAHELTHVGQYRMWGVERFAWEYVRDLGNSVESQANENANTVVSQWQYKQYSITNGLPLPAEPSQRGTSLPVPNVEVPFFIAQCYFKDVLPNVPIQFLVNRMGQIIVVNQMTGQWFQVGWATPPRYPGSAWTYKTMFAEYDVMPDGRILSPLHNGMQVGFVRQL